MSTPTTCVAIKYLAMSPSWVRGLMIGLLAVTASAVVVTARRGAQPPWEADNPLRPLAPPAAGDGVLSQTIEGRRPSRTRAAGAMAVLRCAAVDGRKHLVRDVPPSRAWILAADAGIEGRAGAEGPQEDAEPAQSVGEPCLSTRRNARSSRGTDARARSKNRSDSPSRILWRWPTRRDR